MIRSKNMSWLTVGIVALVGSMVSLAHAASSASADEALAGKSDSLDALIGTWQGEVQEYRAISGTSKFERITTPRTLIIYWDY